MKQNPRRSWARWGWGVLASASLGSLTGCVSYQSTAEKSVPGGRVPLTGSRLDQVGDSAKDAARAGAAPVAVYSREDIDRSGASDLAEFLARVPSARIHR